MGFAIPKAYVAKKGRPHGQPFLIQSKIQIADTQYKGLPSSRIATLIWSYQHKILIYIREILIIIELHEGANLRERFLLHGAILVSYSEVVMDRLTILKLYYSHTTFTKL